MKKQLVISFSGGLTSAYMTKLLLDIYDRREWEIAVVFANTGKEREETFQFILDCDKHFHFNTVWVEAFINPERGQGTRHTVVSYETACRKGEPFEQMILKYGLPNIRCKQCTRELKINAIRSYAKNALGWTKFYTAMGIRADEAKRVDKEQMKRRFIYPLVHQFPTTRKDVNTFWSAQPFTLELTSYQGNCDFCFEKSDRKLITLCKEDPEGTKWWIEMEQKYRNYIPEGKNPNMKIPVNFYRGNRSIQHFIEQARMPFVPAKDESKEILPFKEQFLFPINEYVRISN